MSCRFAWSEAYQQFHTQAKSRANSAAAAVLRLTVNLAADVISQKSRPEHLLPAIPPKADE